LGETDFVADTLRHTSGVGASVVYDGVGLATFEGSLAALRPTGTLAYFGQASGPVPLVDLWQLPKSVKVVHPVLSDFVPSPSMLLRHSSEIFSWLQSGQISVTVGGKYRFEQAKQAHEELENRRSVGKLLLIP
jgi:NADPH2:quinone reductase